MNDNTMSIVGGGTPIIDTKSLSRRLDNIEHKEIAEIKRDISDMRAEMAGNKVAMEQNTKVLDRLSETLEKTTQTMTELSLNIQYSNESMKKLENKVDSIKGDLKSVEDKSKFDILCWMRDNFLSVILTIGALAYMIHQMI